MNDKRNEVSQVQDKPAEIWIKLLFFITAIAVGLVAYVGDRVIAGQDRMNAELSKMSSFLQTHESRISRNEKDIRELARFHKNIRLKGE